MPMSTDCIREKERGAPSFQWGLAPAECKDHGVFIFISEEIKKKKPGNKCQTSLPAAFPASADEAEVAECET